MKTINIYVFDCDEAKDLIESLLKLQGKEFVSFDDYKLKPTNDPTEYVFNAFKEFLKKDSNKYLIMCLHDINILKYFPESIIGEDIEVCTYYLNLNKEYLFNDLPF